MIRRAAFALSAVLLVASSAGADSARSAWVNAKCALCHGMDGASQTDTGKKTKAPDLRQPATQKQTDEALGKSIAAGHDRMPSFRKQIDAERVKLLVQFIRGFAKK